MSAGGSVGTMSRRAAPIVLSPDEASTLGTRARSRRLRGARDPLATSR